MLARRLTTILPAMTLAEALETPRLHRTPNPTGARTAVVTAHMCRAPPQTIFDVGRIGNGQVPLPGAELRLGHGETSTGVGAEAEPANVGHGSRPDGRVSLPR